MTEPIRSFSNGGGWQSTAGLVLAARGVIDFPLFLFSNVGDDSEHPATPSYVREVQRPYAERHGIEVVELHKRKRNGDLAPTLWQRLMAEGSRSLPIPVRMPDTGAPGTRSCTADHKIRVVQRWLREHGASEDNPATVAIGISTDEWQRANSRIVEPFERLVYPLLHVDRSELGLGVGVGVSRSDCATLITDAGLPLPPKSSCFFCPFHRPDTWRDQARDEPELFAKSTLLEDTLNERRRGLPCPGGGKRPREAFAKVSVCSVHGDACTDDFLDCDEYRGEVTVERQWLEPWGTCSTCRVRYDLVGGQLPEGVPDHPRVPVYLTRFGKPLREVVNVAAGVQESLWLADEGYRCGDVCDT